MKELKIPVWVEVVIPALSLVLFVGTLVLVPWMLTRLPADHFVRPPRRHSLAVVALRDALGASLVALGLLMLVLPGQGLLTIVLGLSVLEFRAKRRVVLSLLRRPRVARAVQRLRERAGKPPLVLPGADGAREA